MSVWRRSSLAASFEEVGSKFFLELLMRLLAGSERLNRTGQFLNRGF